jgi:AraC-like DNA-binding protein
LDAILIQLFIRGSVQFGVGQRITYAKAGDIVIFDLAQTVDNINLEFDHITSMWPRSAVEELIPNIASWHGLSLPSKSPVTRLLRQHMISSHKLAGHFAPSEGQRVEEATLSLLSAAVEGKNLPRESAESPAMKELLAYQIKRYIRQNLGVSDLVPEQIAQHFGISRRQLYHLLEPVGGISRYQLKLRLERSMSDLQNPAFAHQSLSEIAYRCGFKYPATFSRNFRATFGISPGDARAQVLSRNSAPAPQTANTLSTQSAREHHQWFHAIGI